MRPSIRINLRTADASSFLTDRLVKPNPIKEEIFCLPSMTSLLKKSFIELYEEGKYQKCSLYNAHFWVLTAKGDSLHFPKLICLVFQQADDLFRTHKPCRIGNPSLHSHAQDVILETVEKMME